MRKRYKTTLFILLFIFGVYNASNGVYASFSAGSDAVRRASGDTPSAKTEKTVKAEKELEKLTAAEKKLKEQITESAINRSKLLAQKRAELKQVRQIRDAAINKELDSLKTKKVKQTAFIAEAKTQLSEAKKKKNAISQATLEITLKAAQSKLTEINADIKESKEKLAKSYQDYKAIYDNLTYLDSEMKKMLDTNQAAELKIKEQKTDFSKTKGEYNQSLKDKDYLTAERRMESLVFIQTGINDNYSGILNIKLKVKSDYYAQIVNYRI